MKVAKIWSQCAQTRREKAPRAATLVAEKHTLLIKLTFGDCAQSFLNLYGLLLKFCKVRFLPFVPVFTLSIKD